MSDNERSIFWICVILTMAMAFTALMIALPRVCDIHSNINFDYQTMIVTILGIFITALIGWQIWATIISRNEIRRVEEAAERITRLEAELNTQRNIFTRRNFELQELVEAHVRMNNAINASFHSESYAHFANAIIHFLNSNVSLQYRPFQEALRWLSDSLINLEHEGSEDDIRSFLEDASDYDGLYDNIVAAIHRREEDIRDLHREIIGIRENRLELRDRLQSRQSPPD